VVFFLALLAAFGCALFNGISAILQKIGADKEKQASSLRTGMMLRLLKDWPYLAGVLLDLLAGVLTLVAVHSLPLFVAQPIIALSVVVTLLIEIVVFNVKPNKIIAAAFVIIVAGLALLMISANAKSAISVSSLVKTIITTAPLLLAVIGIVFVKGKSFMSTAILAGVSGLAFGGTSIVGRMLNWQKPFWHEIFSLLFLALVAYGLVGILLFTVALQRHKASVINCIMIIFETLTPTFIGLLFLGDRPKHGFWPLMIIGLVVTIIGILVIAADSSKIEASSTKLSKVLA
jgi:drug/metabolite transporter (DMT)-like permease